MRIAGTICVFLQHDAYKEYNMAKIMIARLHIGLIYFRTNALKVFLGMCGVLRNLKSEVSNVE